MRLDLLGPLSYVRSVSGIDPQQAAQLEAIGYALDTLDAVYERLAQALRDDLPESHVLAFSDAWSIIDWSDRTNFLVLHCRGLPQRQSEVVEFLAAADVVGTMRNIYEHPEGEIVAVAASRRSLWGHLAWQRRVEGGHEVSVITPFSRWEGEFDLPADHERPPRSEVDRISLFSPDGRVEISLTDVHVAAVRFARQLDAAVSVGRPRTEEGAIMRLTTWLAGAGA